MTCGVTVEQKWPGCLSDTTAVLVRPVMSVDSQATVSPAGTARQLSGGGVLGPGGCRAASLASTHQAPAAPSGSGQPQMSPDIAHCPWGEGQNRPWREDLLNQRVGVSAK